MSVALLAVCLSVSAQDIAEYAKGTPFPEGMFSPATPEVSSMMRYGSGASANLYTGAARLDIGLYAYADRYFSIPVTLTYCADGYRPNAPAYSAGYGWSVNVGGAITREVRGLPDEARSRTYAYRNKGDGSIDDVFTIAGASGYGHGILKQMLSDYYRSTTENVDGYGYRSVGKLSLEPVDFAYSGEIGREYVLIQKYGNSYMMGVETEPDLYHFNFMDYSGSFTLDGNGKCVVLNSSSPAGELSISYNYNKTSPHMTTFSIKTGDDYVYTFSDIDRCVSHGSWNPDDSYDDEDIISSWKLSSIMSPVGEEVRFVYSGFPIERSYVSPEICVDKFTITEKNSGRHTSWKDSDQYYEGTVSNTVSEHLLTGIIIDNRVEMSFAYATDGRLTDFFVWNSDRQIVRHCTFDVLPCGNQTLLKGLSISGEGKYSMDYYGEDSAGSLPSVSTPKVDWYGFYSTAVSPAKYTRGSLTAYRDKLVQSKNRSDFTSARSLMLKKITYPTGGWSTYEYEQNLYAHEYRKSVSCEETSTGGVRVSRVSVFDGDGECRQWREYGYVDADGRSSGILFCKPDVYYNYELESPTLSINREVVMSMADMGSVRNGHIGYSRVLERTFGKVDVDGTDALASVVEYSFLTPDDGIYEEQYHSSTTELIAQDGWTFVCHNYGSAPSEWQMSRNSLHGGLLKERRVYSGDVSNANLVRRWETDYGLHYHAGLKTRTCSAIFHCGHYERNLSLASLYTLRSRYTEYDGNHEPFVSKENRTVQMSEAGRPLVYETADSRGRTVVTENRYRTDSPALLDTARQFVDGKVAYEMAYGYTKFTVRNRSVLLPSSVSTGAVSSSGKVIGHDKVLTVVSYDDYGNPNEVKDALGNTTYYQWGYWGLHLVRKEVHFPKYRLVTLWTYKPLIGMTSYTAPDHIETSYGMDEWGRLTSVIEGGGIIGKYEYNIVNF